MKSCAEHLATAEALLTRALALTGERVPKRMSNADQTLAATLANLADTAAHLAETALFLEQDARFAEPEPADRPQHI